MNSDAWTSQVKYVLLHAPSFHTNFLKVNHMQNKLQEVEAYLC